MTSQIGSHIEYLIPTYNILLLISFSKLMKNLASMTVFTYDLLIWFFTVSYFFGPPCRS